jgi:hypothetical protein
VPQTSELDGTDPVAYIISTNVQRRHMTKGQRAMAVATIYPEAKRGRGNKDEAGKAAEAKGFSATRLLQARIVLKWAPELGTAVLSGAHSLDSAYEIATERMLKAEAPS